MKGNEAGTTNREKGEKFQSGWFREIILIVLTAICTTLATQIFYKQNITSQIKMEVAKDLVLEQYHIYNKVKSLKEHYQIITYKGKFNVREIKITIYVDQFKNEKGKKEILDSVVKQDTITIVAPTFIFQDSVYDIFIENLHYIRDNLNELEPETYEIAVQLFDLLEKHPIPAKDKRIKYVLVSGWNEKEVQQRFEYLIHEMYNHFQNRLDQYFP